ncbi:helix-turn-helix domain-containing protein [Vibrio alginolyticus]|uniref:helix-turn-helix domain-containing protein n=1 Tax=Vibrio alginolyticus TaxID=663 RepID=UPI002119DB91|nr:helix-turn-helix domain-containing protein [Vibrio alginolyticus]MCQ9071723.1 helix-turn-helix domain-containing protein [Vibrio alginolyticus]
MGNYITISVACNSYNVTRKTIYNWRTKGLLKEKRQGRSVLIDADSIEAVITPKLPSKVTQTSPQVLEEIQKLHDKIDRLEGIITQLLPQKSSKSTPTLPKQSGKRTQVGANQKRQQKAIDKARSKFLELGSPKISRAELARLAGVDRNTVGKHWETITQLNLPNTQSE